MSPEMRSAECGVRSPDGRSQLTREQAEALANQVVADQARLDKLTAEMSGRVAQAMLKIREEYDQKIKDASNSALANSEAVKKWLEENRHEVLAGERQSFETAIAKVGFRKSPPRLEPQTGLSWDGVLDRLRRMAKRFVTLADGTKVSYVTRFVRIKEEVAVAELKRDLAGRLVGDVGRRAIGVELKQEELFFICAR